MRVVLDACVLFPTVLREVLIGAACAGLYEARWSPRIREEWVRAAAKLGPAAEVVARGESVALDLRCPGALVTPREGAEARLWLPDPADIHVLAAAIAARADAIVTLNAADFPRDLLAAEGIDRIDPDTFLVGLHDRDPGAVGQVVAEVTATACRLSGQAWTARALLKKARLPRLAKRLS